MVQLKFYGFVFCFQTFGFLVFLRLHYGVITWILLIYQSIFFFYAHTKHVEVVANQEIQIHFISSENQLCHVLTKPLSFAVFVRFLSKLHVGALFSA
jgi:hypothetical protein